MSQSADNLQPQSPKLLLSTALITAVATIGAAFLGVVPQLRSKDVGQIEALQQQVEQLKQQANVISSSGGNSSTATVKTLVINGTVLDPTAGRPLTGAQVYLVPLSNPKLMALTSNDGEFRFKGIPDQRYWIVVRDSDRGNSSAGFIDEDNSEVKFSGALIKYKVEK